jgi:hypothetical protein
MDEPLTVPVEIGGRTITMRPPNDSQIVALLDFERQAGLLAKRSEGPEKNTRSLALARRSLMLVEKLTVDPADWDWLMDSMVTQEVEWEEFNDLPYRLFEALEKTGNRASRRSAARATRTRKD